MLKGNFKMNRKRVRKDERLARKAENRARKNVDFSPEEKIVTRIDEPTMKDQKEISKNLFNKPKPKKNSVNGGARSQRRTAKQESMQQNRASLAATMQQISGTRASTKKDVKERRLKSKTDRQETKIARRADKLASQEERTNSLKPKKKIRFDNKQERFKRRQERKNLRGGLNG